MKRTRQSRYLTLFLITLLGAACGGDDGTGVDDALSDLDGADIQAAMTSLYQPLDATADARGTFEVALASLAQQGVELAPESALRAAPEAFRSRMAGAVFQPLVEFPPAVQGETFVYSSTEMGWVIDESRTGAPASGVRIIFYEMSGGFPISDLELGYIDLTDRDTGSSDGLGIRIVRFSDDAVLADVVQRWSETETTAGSSLSFNASGFFGNGATQVDFEITQTGTLATNEDETYTFSMLFEGPQGSYQWVIDGDFTAATDIDRSDQTITVKRNDVSTVLALEATETGDVSEADGTLSHNGVVIADVVLENQDIQITKPGGGAFEQAQQQELRLLAVNMVFTGFILLFSTPVLLL